MFNPQTNTLAAVKSIVKPATLIFGVGPLPHKALELWTAFGGGPIIHKLSSPITRFALRVSLWPNRTKMWSPDDTDPELKALAKDTKL
jgi:hypothetical protein